MIIINPDIELFKKATSPIPLSIASIPLIIRFYRLTHFLDSGIVESM
jgi:hypothetical protein